MTKSATSRGQCEINTPVYGIENSIINVDGSVPMCVSRVPPLRRDPRHENVVALIVPGAPGLTGFYPNFIQGLHEASNRSMEIIGISYPGHYDLESVPLPIEGYLRRAQHCPRYSLREQSELVLSFITNQIPKNKKLIVIGHSIGAYVALELLRNFKERERILKMVLVYPILEKVISSPLGRIVVPTVCYVQHAFLIVASAIECIPKPLKAKIMQGFCLLQNFVSSRVSVESLYSLFTFDGISSMLEKANEIGADQDPQHTREINQHQDKITFYYGPSDPFAPITDHDRMKEKFPNADVKRCKSGYKHHVDVLTTREMADQTWECCIDALCKRED